MQSYCGIAGKKWGEVRIYTLTLEILMSLFLRKNREENYINFLSSRYNTDEIKRWYLLEINLDRKL